MSLYLVQHGKSHSKETDPERSLTDEGKKETIRIAEVAKGYGILISGILHSGKKRAAETADIFGSYFELKDSITEKTGMSPNDDVVEFSRGIADKNIMYVGHLPFMERLASYLIIGSSDKTVFKFQNSGIVCLDFDSDTGTWRIKWSLMPHIE